MLKSMPLLISGFFEIF